MEKNTMASEKSKRSIEKKNFSMSDLWGSGETDESKTAGNSDDLASSKNYSDRPVDFYCIYFGDKKYLQLINEEEYGVVIGMRNADVFFRKEDAKQYMFKLDIKGEIVDWRFKIEKQEDNE